MADPTYKLRAGFVPSDWTEVGSTYSWAQLASAFSWRELSAGPVPDVDVLSFSYDRRSGSIYKRLGVGVGRVVLDDDSGDYAPEATTTNCLDPHKIVAFKAITDAGSVYAVATGFVSNYGARSELGRRRTSVEFFDSAEFLRRRVSIGLQQDVTIGSLVALVNTSAGIPDDLVFAVAGEPLEDVAPYAFLDGISAGEAYDRIVRSGAHHSFVDACGRLGFRSRNFDINQTPVATMIDVALSTTYDRPLEAIVNDVRVDGSTRRAGDVTTVAGIVGVAPSVPGNGETSFFVEFADPDAITEEGRIPVQSLVTPVASTDWQLNTSDDGSGSDVTATASLTVTFFAETALVDVANGDANTAYLTKFFIRGAPLRREGFSAREQDAASQDAFGRRTFSLRSDLLAGVNFACTYGEYILTRRADPSAHITFELRNLFPEVLACEMLESLRLVDTHLGVDAEFSIQGIDHEISFDETGLVHTTRFEVDALDPKDWLVLDHATLGKLDQRRLGF